MRILIAGNGPAAISAVEAIRQVDGTSSVIIITREHLPA